MKNIAHGGLAPSDWVVRWAPLLRPGGSVLDVACGQGRHVRWLAARGHAVTGIDRSEAALAGVAGVAETILADIENAPWPLLQAGQPRQFDAVVVTNYLWRPLLPTLAASVAPGGLLIYETFANGNESVGRPTNPDFLLRPGELLSSFADWRYPQSELSLEPGCRMDAEHGVAAWITSVTPAARPQPRRDAHSARIPQD